MCRGKQNMMEQVVGKVGLGLCLVGLGFSLCRLLDKHRPRVGRDASDPLTYVKVRPGDLDLAKLVDMVRSPGAGAISAFSGTTRDNFEDKIVTKLEYEGYVPMAEKELRKICTEIRDMYPDVLHIAIEHKLGDCPILDESVIIAISSGHREAALDACKYAINTLKATVPIWKKELYQEGDPKWKENKEFFAKNEKT